MSKKIVGIVGSYRHDGTIDCLVDQVLESAAEHGASVNKVFLLDHCIEFCTNCRKCTQQPGEQPGRCPLADDMEDILKEIQQADALVLGSPINFGTVTAVMKRFIERTICMAHWPWGTAAPTMRKKRPRKRAVIITSCAAPGFLGRITTSGIGLMKKVATVLGAKTVGTMMVGLVALEQRQDLSAPATRKARRLGKKLAAS